MDNQAYLDMLLAGLITAKKVVNAVYEADIAVIFWLSKGDRYLGPRLPPRYPALQGTEICRENWRNCTEIEG